MRPDSSAGAHTAMLEQLGRRRASLSEELERRARLFEQQETALSRRLAALELEADQLRQELATQAAREASAREQSARFEQLAQQGFVSPQTAHQRRDELLEQTARRQALYRSLLGVRREIGVVAGELKQLPLRAAQQQAEVHREISVAAAGHRERRGGAQGGGDGAAGRRGDGHRGRARSARRAAAAGDAAAVRRARWKRICSPRAARSASSSVARQVRVRFAAYPFQKFGQYDGEVVQVSRVALATAELPPQLAAARAAGSRSTASRCGWPRRT